MRILVISDSHRNKRALEKAIRSEPNARHIFFLGDLTEDIEEVSRQFPDKIPHVVAGNCDFLDSHKTADTDEIDGVKIFFTHGHRYYVKDGTSRLAAAARERGCSIALFGHTHLPFTAYEDGLYIVNPGSCAESRSGCNTYAVIDIMPAGILPAIKNL